MRPRSRDPCPEGIGTLVLRLTQTLRTTPKIHRDKSQFSRKRPKLQPGLDQGRAQASLPDSRQCLGHTSTLQRRKRKDHLCMDGSSPRIRLSYERMGRKKGAAIFMEEVLV